jgi:hypothetical protein
VHALLFGPTCPICYKPLVSAPWRMLQPRSFRSVRCANRATHIHRVEGAQAKRQVQDRSRRRTGSDGASGPAMRGRQVPERREAKRASRGNCGALERPQICAIQSGRAARLRLGRPAAAQCKDEAQAGPEAVAGELAALDDDAQR